MTADRWTQAVRDQLGLGRLLPLGGPLDGAWIAEGAAGAVLRRAAAEVPGVRLGALRIALADPQDVDDPVVPAPPSALPPGPLRLTAEVAATAAEPLPVTTSRLRTALATAAEQRLGLTVAEVDLRVTELLDAETEAGEVRSPEPPRAREATGPDEARAAAAALAVPGVTHLTGTLGGLGRAVYIEDARQDPARSASLPHRHVRVEVAVSGDHRPLDVARQVRPAVGEALDDHPTVAVLVTTVG
ncbi:nucleopolyhedrovirus P10 family protein [Streptomyces sp. NPDC046805]|uniref:nucleopolyhedrovirus P10 family protein n=1 Tax=Streptomyces sp. NPDC046805 TaxID=3155134 RepID=UPI0033DF2BE4